MAPPEPAKSFRTGETVAATRGQVILRSELMDLIQSSELGELIPFVYESQIVVLEDMMWDQGALNSSRMSAAFRTLRSDDLV